MAFRIFEVSQEEVFQISYGAGPLIGYAKTGKSPRIVCLETLHDGVPYLRARWPDSAYPPPAGG